jgi:hypothetical protein
VTDSHSSEGENPRKVLEMRKRDSYALWWGSGGGKIAEAFRTSRPDGVPGARAREMELGGCDCTTPLGRRRVGFSFLCEVRTEKLVFVPSTY